MINKELVKRYERIYGREETKQLLNDSKRIIKDQYVRVNISKIKAKEIEEFLKGNRVKFSKTFLPNSFKIEKSFFNLTSSLPALAGEIYMQDIASQVPVNLIDFSKLKKKIRVLDMAASPGSKTTQLADLLTFNKIDYEIVALEPEQKRLTKLINNIQRQSFPNIKVLQERGETFKDNSKFDLILLDAPCSGNVAGDYDWLSKRDLSGIKKMSALQKKLLENASKLLKDNGTLIYSTCSIEEEEDEQNVKWAIDKLKLKIVEVNSKLPTKKTKYGHKFIPHKSKTQGFFVTILKKN